MGQSIHIPGLKGQVQASVLAVLGDLKTEFPDGYDATFKLPNRKLTTKLFIGAGLVFPSDYDPEEEEWHISYSQWVSGTFNNIVLADGVLTFSDTQITLQGEPAFGHPSSTSNRFRYIDGTAWVSASNNPRIPVIKIKLTVGSQDVDVIAKAVTTTDPSWKESFELGGGVKPGGLVGWVVSKFVDIDVKVGVKFERSGEVKTHGTTRTTTVGQLFQQRVWTLSLQMPDLPAPPGPFGLPEPYKVYFDTGKSNADNYRSPLNGMMDQIKGLRDYMDAIDKAYGLENIQSATVAGYASGLGDLGPNGSRPNINLSLDRARYVAELLSTLYHVEIPRNKVTPKGSPINSTGKDNKAQDRRAELSVMIRGGARRR
jgi:outer membrane protein OmpA-like peptidoglycan-associated protein